MRSFSSRARKNANGKSAHAARKTIVWHAPKSLPASGRTIFAASM